MDRASSPPLELPDRTSENDAVHGYRDVLAVLEDWIRAGRYTAGDRFPSEKALCEEFGVSRVTVNRALNILRDNGTLVRERGRGSFVSMKHQPQSKPMTLRQVIRRDLEKTEGFSNTHLSTASVTATDALRVLFEIPDQQPIVEADFLVRMNGRPFAYVIGQFPMWSGEHLLQATDDLAAERMVNIVLARHGILPARIETSVAAIAADPDVARRLDLHPGVPILKIVKLHRNEADDIYQRTLIYNRSDICEFDFEYIAEAST